MLKVFVGGVGTGKSYVTSALAVEDSYKNLASNSELNKDLVVAKHKRTWRQWRTIQELTSITCSSIIWEEIHLWLNSRKIAEMPDEVRDWISEHRKKHVRIYANTQHISFLDRIFRILADEICLVSKWSIPILGWICPSCVRPDVICGYCGEIRQDDGIGDRNGWRKWFGFGTVFFWWAYPASVLKDIESANGQGIEMQSMAIPCGFGFKFFNKNLIYNDTSAELSKLAHACRKNSRDVN